MKFSNIRLLVNDFDKCFRFYNDTLGLECTWGKLGDNFASFNLGIESGLAIFRAELMNVAIEGFQAQEYEKPSDQFVIVVNVNNLDDSYETLKSRGIHFITSPKDMNLWGIRVAHFRDPENNLIELYTDLPKSQWAEHLLEDEKVFKKDK